MSNKLRAAGDSAEEVRKYYNKNTGRFIRIGQGGKLKIIHRAVYSAGNVSKQSALGYIDRRIAEEISRIKPERCMDLGCGVGGSIAYLSGIYLTKYTGITISEVQLKKATRVFKNRHIDNFCEVILGNLEDPAFLGTWDTQGTLFAFAIESLSHVSHIEPLLRTLSRVMKSQDQIMVWDDFLRNNVEPNVSSDRQLIEVFKNGWHVNGLRSSEDFIRLADKCGFSLVSSEDYSGRLMLKRFRDRLIKMLLIVLRMYKKMHYRSQWISALSGGDALQTCLMRKLVEFRCIILRKRGPG